MNTPVDLALKPSMRAHRLLFWLHALPLCALPFAVQSGPVLLALATAIALSWVWLRRHPSLGHGPEALGRIVARPDGCWVLETTGGRQFEARLLGDSYRQPGLIVMNFRDDAGRRWTRVLLGDELSDEAMRRLRQRLSEPLTNPLGEKS